MNIISNAIDVLRESSTSPVASVQKNFLTIQISTEVAQGDRAVIRISDNGPGMTGSLELTVIFLPNQKSKLIRELESYQS